MKFKSVHELINKTASKLFKIKWLIHTQLKLYEDPCLYQDLNRIYLDEYSEQKELREEWFYINHSKALYIFQEGVGHSINRIYDHFENRFLRRT